MGFSEFLATLSVVLHSGSVLGEIPLGGNSDSEDLGQGLHPSVPHFFTWKLEVSIHPADGGRG